MKLFVMALNYQTHLFEDSALLWSPGGVMQAETWTERITDEVISLAETSYSMKVWLLPSLVWDIPLLCEDLEHMFPPCRDDALLQESTTVVKLHLFKPNVTFTHILLTFSAGDGAVCPITRVRESKNQFTQQMFGRSLLKLTAVSALTRSHDSCSGHTGNNCKYLEFYP